MRTTRLFHADPLAAGGSAKLGDDTARYLIQVLRIEKGDALALFDGRGGEYAARVADISRNLVIAEVTDHTAVERESPLRITLAQGISRGDRMDHVVQKATELGVSEIVPLHCERGVVRLGGERATRRREHWRSVAIAACQQCGRNRLPEIRAISGFGDWLVQAEPGLIFAAESTDALSSHAAPGASITLLVGPEGGFDVTELEAALARGWKLASLGPRILRTETAAIAAVALVQSRWGDMR